MAHPARLRSEVVEVRRIRVGLDRHAFDDLDPVLGESLQFRRIVRQHPRALDPELSEYGRGRRIIAPVDGQAERDVRVDGVEPSILQRVRADLVEQPDTASLMPEVEQYSAVSAADLI